MLHSCFHPPLPLCRASRLYFGPFFDATESGTGTALFCFEGEGDVCLPTSVPHTRGKQTDKSRRCLTNLSMAVHSSAHQVERTDRVRTVSVSSLASRCWRWFSPGRPEVRVVPAQFHSWACLAAWEPLAA